jgi:hypothetical protein
MAAARQRRLRPVGALRAVTKKVWLEGHPFDLQALAELLPSGDTRVVREGDQFYLTSSDIENPPDGVKPYVVAKGLLPTINGLARVHNPDFRPVELSGKYTDGGSTTIFPPAATLEFRGNTARVTVTDPDGNIVFPRPSPGPDRFALARSHTDLADALKIMARSTTLEWRDLYDVVEIIRRSVEPKKIWELGWATDEATVKRFTGSTQPHRHARPSGVHPNPMSLAEGRDFVNGLVIEWMQSLAQ